MFCRPITALFISLSQATYLSRITDFEDPGYYFELGMEALSLCNCCVLFLPVFQICLSLWIKQSYETKIEHHLLLTLSVHSHYRYYIVTLNNYQLIDWFKYIKNPH